MESWNGKWEIEVRRKGMRSRHLETTEKLTLADVPSVPR